MRLITIKLRSINVRFWFSKKVIWIVHFRLIEFTQQDVDSLKSVSQQDDTQQEERISVSSSPNHWRV